MTDLNIVKGTYGYNITLTLTDADGTAVNLTGATIKFKMAEKDAATLKVDGNCTILDAVGGICYYTLVSADTDTAGLYKGEIEATWTSPAKVQTWKFSKIIMEADLP
jgi:hypothetical protein